MWGQETLVPHRPKPEVSCFPEREPSGASLRGNIRQTPFFFLCILPKSLNAGSHLYYHLMVFPVSPLPTDTLSVPRWSPQIPRRDLGNSIKHRYGNPTAAPGESPPVLGDEHLYFYLWSRTGGSGPFPLFPMLGCAVLEAYLNSISVQIWFR